MSVELIQLPLGIRALQNIEFPHKLGVMERLFRRRLERYGICWVKTGAGLGWKLDLTNCTHRWIAYGKYEGAGFHRWAKRFLPRDGIIVDSGANIGQMAMYLAQLVPAGKVLAFEPGGAQAEWLDECLRANRNLPVEVVRMGLGAKNGSVLLTDEGAANTHGGQSYVSSSSGNPIRIVRLENELGQRGIGSVCLWKLDVEGYEIPALEGAGEFIKQHAIKAVYVELHAENGWRITRWLENKGYRCFLINDHGHTYAMRALPEHTNGLFLTA